MKVEKIRIGIPKALAYYSNQKLWNTFFTKLGCELVYSNDTNIDILKHGIKYSIDESCLSVKIFIGHVYNLIGKVDYILIPRLASYAKNEFACTKFNGLYDIVCNTFSETKLISYNIDKIKGCSEFKEFLKLGLIFTKNIPLIIKSYLDAKSDQINLEIDKINSQNNLVKSSNKIKLLIVSHPYNTHDKFIGYPTISYLSQLGVDIVYSEIYPIKKAIQNSNKFSKMLYWKDNKKIIGSIWHYINFVDGIIFLSVFPCGTDSLVNELLIRKLNNIPIMNIIIDELQAESGLHTRLESFVDIIKARIGNKANQK